MKTTKSITIESEQAEWVKKKRINLSQFIQAFLDKQMKEDREVIQAFLDKQMKKDREVKK